MSAFKKLNRQDVFVTSYTSKKEWSTSESTPSTFGIEKYEILSGSLPYYSGSDNYEKYLRYDQLRHLYYSNFSSSLITGSFENYIQSSLESGSRILLETGSVLSIPRDVTGQRIEPGSTFLYFVSQSDYVSFLDNGEGKLVVSQSGGDSFEVFNVGGGTNAQVTSTAVDTDGKVYIGGLFTNYSGSATNYIARLNSDGTLDTTFNIGTGFGASSNIRTIAPLPSGDVVVGGSFSSYNGTSISNIAKISSNGTLDNTFRPQPSSAVNVVYIQADGKILVGGEFSTISGSSIGRIARLNSNGTLDSDFNPGVGLGSTVHDIAVQTDGKIIIAGNSTSYSGSTVQKVFRILDSGSVDTSFTAPNIGAGTPYSLYLDSSEKVLVGGAFSSPTNDIMRLLTNGTQDTSFVVGVGSNNVVRKVKAQSTDKIIIAGSFTQYSGSTVGRLARLETTGELDTTFDIGSGFDNNEVLTVTVQENDYLVVGGSYTLLSGSTQNRIVRLGPDGETQGIQSTISSTIPTGSVVGDIIYTHGLAIVTDENLAEVISSTSNYTASWQSNYPVLTQNVICKVSDFEFNFTQNPSAVTGSSGQLRDNVTGSDFRPYITAIGLYNDANELIAVAKLGQPLPKPSYVDTTFIIKLDL